MSVHVRRPIPHTSAPGNQLILIGHSGQMCTDLEVRNASLKILTS